MVVRSLLSKVTGLIKKNTPKKEIISKLKKEAYRESEINRAIDFVDKTLDFVEETVEFVEGGGNVRRDCKLIMGKIMRRKKRMDKKNKEKKNASLDINFIKEKKVVNEKEKVKEVKKVEIKKKEPEAKKEKPKETPPSKKETEKVTTTPKKETEKTATAPKKEKTKIPQTSTLSSKTIKTEIDQLLSLINEKGKIKISDAAKAIGVDSKTIEDWAKILEAQEMVIIKYHTIGEIEILKIKEKEEKK